MRNIVKEINALLKVNEVKENSLTCSMYLDENFTGFDGHFENTPVLPAICYFSIIKNAIKKVLKDKEVTISEIKDAKFFRIAAAKETLEVIITSAVGFTSSDFNGEVKVEAVFSRNNEKCAKIKAFLKIH